MNCGMNKRYCRWMYECMCALNQSLWLQSRAIYDGYKWKMHSSNSKIMNTFGSIRSTNNNTVPLQNGNIAPLIGVATIKYDNWIEIVATLLSDRSTTSHVCCDVHSFSFVHFRQSYSKTHTFSCNTRLMHHLWWANRFLVKTI